MLLSNFSSAFLQLTNENPVFFLNDPNVDLLTDDFEMVDIHRTNKFCLPKSREQFIYKI